MFLWGGKFPSVIKRLHPPFSDLHLFELTSFVYSDLKFGAKNQWSKFTVVSIPANYIRWKFLFLKWDISKMSRLKKFFQNVIETNEHNDNFSQFEKQIGIKSYICHLSTFSICFRMKSYKMTNPFFQKVCCVY